MALTTISSSFYKRCFSRGMGGEGRPSRMQEGASTLLPPRSSITRLASRSTACSAEALLVMGVCSLLAASAGQGQQWISHHQHPSHRTGATFMQENEFPIQAAEFGVLWLLHLLNVHTDLGSCITP